MSAPVGMLLVDLNTTNLLEINPAYTNIVGRSVSEIKRVGWQKITHSDDLKEIIYKLEQLKLGKINHFKMLTRFIKPEGSIVWAHLTVSTIDDEGILENPQFLAILEDVTERKNFEEKIWHQANFDFLTNLPNRNMLNDRIAQTVKTARRNQSEFAVLLIDLDHFKDVNDTLGHDRGDELLVEAAKRILLCVRESDTVARVGGDEFTIILSALSGLSGVGKVAQNILDSLSEPFYLGKNTTYISASIGITLYPKDASESISLIKNADQAMYFAKEQGRNGYHFFTAAMQQSAQRRLQLVNELRDAIKNEEFVLYYQPIVELANDKIYKAEALIRWQHPKRGLVSPAEFIAVAEETRMINAIGDWVFLEAVQQSKRWRALLDKNFQINVNASPVQFEKTANFSWENHLALMDISGSSIGIEITEGLLMTSDQSALHTLLEFRDAGIQVSLDDFGTGYSSLSYLRKFDIDYLKIDQSFVQNLDYDSDDLALCSAIVVMAHTLGIKVVAEGIETQLQKDLLLSINCDFGQGYLFSRPVPAHEFEKLVSKTNSSKTEIIC
ncbi:MAG: EAL domain-containing protein [Saccharospirillaceae bacterium]|nr:EAL domain-containing protein [Saccharospirillaceae bacterium]